MTVKKRKRRCNEIRDTHQTISVNICSESLLSPMIFRLKCAGKTGVFVAQMFVIWVVM